jgi:cell division septation protein DedD
VVALTTAVGYDDGLAGPLTLDTRKGRWRRGLTMNDWIRTVAAAAVMVAAPAAAQNVKAGVDAWGRGDYKAAVDQWRGPAMAGDADAQYNLAQAYKLGRGVPVDPALAESWFHKAALQGHYQAEDNYGLALFTAGKKAEALPWLEKSVARGEPRAQLVLGTMLFNGDGVGRDYPRAYALMTRASQQGMKSASETLAQMDQYISPEDRQKGVALAQRYAAIPKPAPQIPGASTASTRAPAAMQTGATPRGAVKTMGVPPSTAAIPAVPPETRTAARAPTRQVTPPERETRAAPARAGGAYRIQLGAFSSQANAEKQWAKVRGRLGNASPDYVRAGRIIRLQATGYASNADAARACRASGVSCVVVAP